MGRDPDSQTIDNAAPVATPLAPAVKWSVLAIAILSEVVATLALRAAIDHPGWGVLTAAGYVVAFGCMTVLLRGGGSIGSIYGIWAASGVALTAIFAAVIFGDALTVMMLVGIAIVMIGVILVETGHPKPAAAAIETGVER